MASGAPVPPDAEQDVLRAEVVGKEAKQRFIAERLTHGASPIKFFDPIPKSKLKSMEASNKTVKLTAPQGKVITTSFKISFVSRIKLLNFKMCRITLNHELGGEGLTAVSLLNQNNQSVLVTFSYICWVSLFRLFCYIICCYIKLTCFILDLIICNISITGDSVSRTEQHSIYAFGKSSIVERTVGP